MFSWLKRRSPFVRALHDYGLERCSMSGEQLWVGLPPDAAYARRPVTTVPEAPKSVLFVEAPLQAELVAAFTASTEAATVEHLMIGTSHDFITPERPTPYDMSGAVAALWDATLPALRRLSLGDMEKLFNGHAYYGRVGDITPVFAAAPNLERLDVCGCFALTRAVHHDRLEALTILLDEIGVSGGPLSPATVTNLLSSRFLRLRECELALDEDFAPLYDIPDAFFSGDGFPALEAFAMDRLTPEAEQRLSAFKSLRGLRW